MATWKLTVEGTKSSVFKQRMHISGKVPGLASSIFQSKPSKNFQIIHQLRSPGILNNTALEQMKTPVALPSIV